MLGYLSTMVLDAKTMDENDLFIMKSKPNGIIQFNILRLEEPEEANAEGLKAALEKSLDKLNLEIKRSEREVRCILKIKLI